MRSKIRSITPEMKGNVQNSYEGSYGTMYTFRCVLEDGTVGQVSAKSPAPHRFGPGDEVEYQYTAPANPAHTGKLKVEKPKDGGGSAPGQTNGEQPRQEQRSSGWSPAKEASVMIQGMLKSIIETTAPKEQWSELLAHAIVTHDNALRARVKSMAERAAANIAKMEAAAQPPPPAPAPVAQPQHIVGEDEEGLPF